MTPEQWSQMLTAIAALLAAVSWPLILLFIVFYFRGPLKAFVNDLRELTVKAGGVDLTAKRQIRAAALLGAASVARNEESAGELGNSEPRANEIAELITHAAKPKTQRLLNEAVVLWVDDNPSNNAYEIQALEELGILFTISTSTEDALEKIQRRSYDLIISDMSRPPDTRAGYTLLDALRAMKNSTPVIFYTSSSRPEYREEARRRGVFGATNSPRELFQLVIDAVSS